MDDLDMQAYKLLVDPTPPALRGTRPASKMKPNTRFLSHIVREAKSHNAALLAREMADAQKRLKKLDGEDSGEGEDERRHRRRHKDDSNSTRDDDRHRRRRHHRDDDDGGDRGVRGDNRDKHGSSSRHDHSHRSHRSHHSHRSRHRDSSREDREREREKKNRDRESKSRSRRHHRGRDDDDLGDRDTDKDRRKHRERSNSPSSRRSRRRSASPRPSKHHDRQDRNRSLERERTPDQYFFENSDSDYSSDPLDAFVGPKLATSNDSGIRIRGRGAASTSTSSMDKHFAADYDPTNDVEHPLPAPRPQVAPRMPGTITAEDAGAEMQEDRKQLLRDNTERLKAAGFTDKEIAILSRGGRRRLDSSNNSSNSNSGSGSGFNSPWAKKGESREWDRDKVEGSDGPPKPEWAR